MKKLTIIETIRGTAAFSVCLFHFRVNIMESGLIKLDQSGFLSALLSVFSHGYLGVIAFFVLSGFILPYSMLASNYQYATLPKFLLKRCVRIEPPYIISVVLAAVLFYISTHTSSYKGQPFNLTWGNLLAHLGYLPEHLGYHWIQPVYWTLEAEFHFYILIAVLLPFMWRTVTMLISTLLVLLLLSAVIHLYVFHYMPFFVIGIITCARKKGKIDLLTFIIITVISFFMVLYNGFSLWEPIIAVLTALCILYFSYDNRVLLFLGNISFSLYLIHVPLGGRFINLFSRFVSSEWQVYLLLVLALVFTIGLSYLFFIIIEKPSLALSKKLKYNHSFSEKELKLSGSKN